MGTIYKTDTSDKESLDTLFREVNGNLDNTNVVKASNTVQGVVSLDEDSFAVTDGDVKPKLLGFSAYLSGDTAYNNNDTIVFDTESFDTGADYAVATGVFTTPVAGYYLFTAAARATVTVDTKRYGLTLVYDGGSVANSIIAASGTGAIGTCVSKLIYCAAGKDVHVTYNEDAAGAVTVAGGILYTYFTGHLIAKD